MSHNYIDDLFSLENIYSYAYASIELAQEIEKLNDKNYKNILMPSRGMFPFYNQARIIYDNNFFQDYYGKFDKKKLEKTFKRRWNSPFLKSQIWIPFTSDTGNVEEDNYSNSIRKSWVRSLKAILDEDEQNPYYKLLEFGFSLNEFKYGINNFNLVKDSGLIYMDTVVSGKAVTEIMNSFEKEGIKNYYGIFIIDKNGEKLKPEYKNKLEQLKAENKVSLIYVNRLFTEDKGPIISGISSFVFPSLMNEIPNKIPEFKDMDIVGVGHWYFPEIFENQEYGQDYKLSYRKTQSIINMNLYFASKNILSEINDDILFNPDKYKVIQEKSNHDLINIIKNSNSLNKETTLKLTESLIKSNYDIKKIETDISSSHVIRINFSKEIQKKKIRELEKILYEKN
jgi:hypothetical protein